MTSLVGTNVSNTTTVTIPAHQAGDMIVIWASRGATTFATLPTGFTPILTKASTSGSPVSGRLGFKIATGTTDTSGTWTNASNLSCHVYRPSAGKTLGIGASGSATSTTNTVNYPAITFVDATGASWAAGFVAVASITETIATAPTGMTNESTTTGATYAVAGHDTEGGVTSWTSQNVTTTGTAGKSVSAVVEIMELPASTGTDLSNLYQHISGNALDSSRGIAASATSPVKCPLSARPSKAGNCIVLVFSYPNGLTLTVTDNLDTWPAPSTPNARANAGSGNIDTAIFVLPNCSAGQRTITVTPSGTMNTFYYDIYEFYGVATSSPVNGSIATAVNVNGPSLAAGSFTPGDNDANGGNIIFTHFGRSSYSDNTFPTRIYAKSPFNLLESNIANIYAGGENHPHASTLYVQTTSVAINPAAVAVGDTNPWNVVAIALKLSSGAGSSPDTGIQVNSIQHFSCGNIPAAATYSLQCPVTGNLRVLCCDDPNINFGTIVVTDSEGGIYTAASTSGFFYSSDKSANQNLVINITSYGGSAQASFRFYDVIGAASAPYDVVALCTVSATGTSFNLDNTFAPTTANGLCIANIGLGSGPGTSATSPAGVVWDLCTYTPAETDVDTTENADIGAHFLNSASGAQTWTFHCVNSTSTSGGVIAFKAATGAPVSVVPSAASISLSGQTPTANIPISLVPDVTSSTLTGTTSTIVQDTPLIPNPNTSILLPTTPTSVIASFFTPNSTSLISSLTTPSSVSNTINSPNASSLEISGTTSSILVASNFVPNSFSAISALTTPSSVLNNVDNPDTFSSNLSITTPTVTFAFNFVPNKVSQFGFNLYSPTVDIDYFIVPGAGSFNFTSTTPVLGLVASLSPATASLLTSDYYVTEASDYYITEGGDYYVTEGGSAPSISFAGSSINLSPVVDSLALVGQIPTVTAQTTYFIVPTSAPLNFTTTTSTINQTTRASLVPTATSLSFATTTSSIILTTSQSLIPISDSLILAPAIPNSVLTTNAPLIISSTSVLLSGTQPLISASLSYNLSPNSGLTILTASTSTITQTNNVNIAPAVVSILFSGSSPSISASNARNLSPDTISTILASSTPNSSWTNNIGVFPSAASVLLSGVQPEISTIFTLSPSSRSSILSVNTPTIAQTNSIFLIPNSLSFLLSGIAPSIIASNARNLLPATTSFNLASTTSNVIWTNNIRISPDPTVSSFTNTTPNIGETFNFYAGPPTIPFNLVPSVPDFIEYEIVTFRKSSTLASIGTRVGTRQELVE